MTFFSGTDMDTLNKIGESMNHCLSLIVNNAGEYNARLTRIVDETVHCSSEAKYKSFNDEQKTFRYEYDAPRKSVEWIPARINKMEPCTLSEEEISSLSDKIDSITKAKEEREKERLSKFNTFGRTDYEWMPTWRQCNNDIGFLDIEDIEREPDNDDINVKRAMYALITGDLFPLKKVLNLNIDRVVEKALEVYFVKKTVMRMYIEEDELCDYIDSILSLIDPHYRIACDVAEALMEYSKNSKWISRLYESIMTDCKC